MSFGRKGLAPGEPVTPLWMRSAPPQLLEREAPISPALAAFLAAERAERGTLPGLSEVAQSPAHARGGDGDRRPPHGPTGSQTATNGGKDKSLLTAYILWWFFGIFGAHRFYLGAYRSGAIQLSILPLLVIIGMAIGGTSLGVAASTTLVPMWFLLMLGWWIIDAFLIPGLARKANEPQVHLAFS